MRLIAAGLSTLALCFTGAAIARPDDPAAAILNTSEQGLTGCAVTLPGFLVVGLQTACGKAREC